MSVSKQRRGRLATRLFSLAFAPTLILAFARCSDLPVQSESPEAATPVFHLEPVGTSGMYCTESTHKLTSTAPYQVCVNPSTWNGDLVVFAPGYRNPYESPKDIGGVSAPQQVVDMGYAWATTNFRENGLVVPSTWIDVDLLELVSTAKTLLTELTNRTTKTVYMTGGSQGGLITVLAVERHPEVFNGGGLAVCGPIGDYGKQLSYIGDFRVVFDYFFKDPVITDWPVWTQSSTVDAGYWWNGSTQTNVSAAITNNPSLTSQLLKVTGAPIDSNDPAASTQQTVLGVLRFSFMGTEDAKTKLEGSAFDNEKRRYKGSDNDAALNAGVQRFKADPDALSNLSALQTTGKLSRPLVTMHTTGDEIVPVSQADLYRQKTSKQVSTRKLHDDQRVTRYGHCNFTEQEILTAFTRLVFKASTQR
jgi:pimeloyl-ACP methyl ester carboxylesterase